MFYNDDGDAEIPCFSYGIQDDRDFNTREAGENLIEQDDARTPYYAWLGELFGVKK
jgi:hypothetical protein